MKKSVVFTSDPDVLGGTWVFYGTRTSVEHIVSLLRKGLFLEVVEDFPHLTEDELHVAYLFIKDEKDEP